MNNNLMTLEKILQICQKAKDPSNITSNDFKDTEFEKMILEYEGTSNHWYAIKPTSKIMLEFDGPEYNYELTHIWYEDEDYDIEDLQTLIDEVKKGK